MIIAVTGDIGSGKSTAARFLAERTGAVLLDADAVTRGLWRSPLVVNAAVERWGAGVLEGHGPLLAGKAAAPPGEGGEISRSRVADRIFADVEEWRWCCGLLHPLVMTELERRARAAGKTATRRTAGVVAEIPLLPEAVAEAVSPSLASALRGSVSPFREAPEAASKERLAGKTATQAVGKTAARVLGWIDATVFVTAPFEIRLRRCRQQRGWDEGELRRREAFLLPGRSSPRDRGLPGRVFVVQNGSKPSEFEAQLERVLDRMGVAYDPAVPERG